MTLRNAITAVFVSLVVGTVGVLPASGQEGTAEQSVREVVEGFRAALAAGDSTTVIAMLHPDVRIYEGGHAETRDQYRSGHLRGDIAFLQAVDSEKTSDHIILDGDMALYMSEDRKTGTYRDREIDSRGTETIVLVRTAEGWKIRHIHWSSR